MRFTVIATYAFLRKHELLGIIADADANRHRLLNPPDLCNDYPPWRMPVRRHRLAWKRVIWSLGSAG
jgi:hypothetical protein